MARTLDDWLAEQLSAHPTEIELGLERVAAVADRLALRPMAGRILTVGGTNGKGSCIALVEGLIGPRARIGRYTSPHLWRYNERIGIDGVPASDADIVAAFEAIAAVRGDIRLTFFEWGTLAALWLFARAGVDVCLLEVGLGGRLDAVNIVDSDVAVVTSIGLDHVDWLGDTREAIGHEKAGILRTGRPAFCGDRAMPDSLATHARAIGADLRRIGDSFDIEALADGQWRIRDGNWVVDTDRLPGVVPENLATAVAATRALGYTVDRSDIRRGLAAQRGLPGRRETIDAPIPIIYDVGHNAEAIDLLVSELQSSPCTGRTHVIIGMLADKPVETVARRLAAVVSYWYPAGLDGVNARGLSAARLAERLGVDAPCHDDPQAALAAAGKNATTGDRIVVCGSFFTVAQARSPEHE